MAVGILQDEAGKRIIVVASSEQRREAACPAGPIEVDAVKVLGARVQELMVGRQ